MASPRGELHPGERIDGIQIGVETARVDHGVDRRGWDPVAFWHRPFLFHSIGLRRERQLIAAIRRRSTGEFRVAEGSDG